jgi:hypothetical protein
VYNRRLKTFATKKKAEDWKVTAQHEVQQGIHTPASTSKTVEEVWRLWLEGRAIHWARSAI